MEKVKMIKKDAIIQIGIGTGYLQQLQKLILFLVKDLKEEQLDDYKKQVEIKTKDNDYEFTEEWMNGLTTISILLRDIENKADEQGDSYEADMSEALGSM
jgi:hypothetical protein